MDDGTLFFQVKEGFHEVLESASMGFSLNVLNIVNGGFFMLLLTWVLVDIFKNRRGEGSTERKSTTLSKITVVSSLIISVSHMGFCLYKLWKLREVVTFDSVIPAMTWSLSSAVTVYSLNRSQNLHIMWPIVLTLWWVYTAILDITLVSFTLLNYFRLRDLHKPMFLPLASVIDITTLPFSVLLCFNALPIGHNNKNNELKPPLLQGDKENLTFHADAYSGSGIWSRVMFNWLNPLFETGRGQKLEFSHVPPIPQSETAEEAVFLLEESLHKQKTQATLLPHAIVHCIWRPLAINAIFAGVNTVASYMGPLLIRSFVNFLSANHDQSSYRQGLILAFIFFLAKIVESLTQRQWYFGAQRIGIRIRAALMVLIYKKSLSNKYGGMSNGKIVNFVNVDVEKVGEFFRHIHGIWLLPVQVTFALIILYRNLGIAPTLAALSSTILVMVSNTPLANMQKNYQIKVMEAKDTRIKATSETLKSMRVLKLHSWESNFMGKLLRLRETERNWLKKYLYTCSAIAFLFWASPTLVSVSTFGVCIVLKTPLTTGVVLSALATFRILQDPIYNLPELISMIAQTRVSVDRIQYFIMEQEKEQIVERCRLGPPNISIEIEPGEYGWETNDSTSRKPTIRISKRMKIPKGSKVAICGSVGAGKSSLLCSILGEIPRISGGCIYTYGSKAYKPQSAWIQTGTIRENILFGREMNKDFYEKVVEGCALDRDIEAWANGDLTVVGERGLNLSGGQKQRIQLARALYSASDVYFLDDPFSAVDAHTGAHMFKKCLTEILDQKTVVYVTHELEFLVSADIVLVIKDGNIVQSGKYEELIEHHEGEFVRQIAAHSQCLGQVHPPTECKCLTPAPDRIIHTGERHEDSINQSQLEEMVPQEERETGRVKFKVYSTFITCAYRGALVPVILLCHILFQGLQMVSNYWIAWATEEERKVSGNKLIGIFVLMSGGSSVFILGRAILLSAVAIETGQCLFMGLITSVFRAPISFFDSTPSSRILNRSSTDQSTVDIDIPYRLAGLVFALIQLLSIIILMCHVAWPICFPFLIVIAISIWYQAYYIKTARELARMIGIQKSPIQHHFSESIAGASTIRCFRQEDRFLGKTLSVIDDYSRVTFHNTATMEWLCVRINFLFNLVFFLLLVALVHLPRSSINPSMAGLTVTYGLSLNVIQAWVIWNLCNVTNKMISVERILQFTGITSEAPEVIENCRPDSSWPISGEVKLQNLYVQYRPTLPIVLKGITCTFPGRNKIGVVGRTGSGKSTLIQALFRVVEPSNGRILIDGVDIAKIGLKDLRSNLSIIPQELTLFQGTIRNNVDPLQQHSDHEIWEVLNKCRLAPIVRQDKRLLNTPVAEDGENWSVGQKQLVCLARVLLQKRKILVLDEATASVDIETDTVMQKTIRDATSRCTVITVAHRIPTIVDSDLVLVLDQGEVVEYDSPAELQRNSSSAFSMLVQEFLKRSST